MEVGSEDGEEEEKGQTITGVKVGGGGGGVLWRARVGELAVGDLGEDAEEPEEK